MHMSDAEIMRSYRQADSDYEKRRKIAILADLNAVSRQKMTDKINDLIAQEDAARTLAKRVPQEDKERIFFDQGQQAKPRKKPGPKPKIPRADAHDALLESVKKPAAGKKKPGRPAKKVPEALIEAAKHECKDIGNAIEQLEREIKELSERMKERLAAWGELKEWLQANE